MKKPNVSFSIGSFFKLSGWPAIIYIVVSLGVIIKNTVNLIQQIINGEPINIVLLIFCVTVLSSILYMVLTAKKVK